MTTKQDLWTGKSRFMCPIFTKRLASHPCGLANPDSCVQSLQKDLHPLEENLVVLVGQAKILALFKVLKLLKVEIIAQKYTTQTNLDDTLFLQRLLQTLHSEYLKQCH